MNFSDGQSQTLRPTGPHLRMENVQVSDSGSYVCQASNGNEPDLSATFLVSVKGKDYFYINKNIIKLYELNCVNILFQYSSS